MLGALAQAVERFPPARRWLVGLSGGLDSVVLLHGLAQLGARVGSPGLCAVHVHHGLHARADAWAQHCQALCDALEVPLDVVRVDARPHRGQSPEAAARHARYQALADQMAPGDALLTAHHRRDQAETLILQLLRGAGPAGLSAMPRWQPHGSGWHGRPLLDMDRSTLEAHARENGLVWVEDDSNGDLGLDRNLLRHEVMPQLRQRWPSLDATLARAAGLQAEAQELLAERAREDLQTLRGETAGTLSILAIRALRRPRQRNALREWWREKGLPAPNQNRLEALLQQIRDVGPDSGLLVTWPGAEVRGYRDSLHAMAPLTPVDPASVWSWDGIRDLALPELGITLSAQEMLRFHGLEPALLEPPLTVRLRRGGETCRLRGQTRILKKLFQEAGIPPWERDRIPLIHAGDRLAVVWGLWCCDLPLGAGRW
ncbi:MULTISPECIES: tRNA lysidine(34) synthetase TilS [unclassified Ectothiorhodospira]|jgi:tRNA(Ile)-lysidine synthase|uniref:tRNA lysidine(34) synthetase TilS n=1 Tax=unclassified Ectothiorhodospira TaxID=2684909 RepID=UPI001EE7CCA6|nr:MULTISPECIES: tRNA lysidine(34) synthetase TilS [unclassified Ectothiorhodospira]MCG5515221.1 tRNA lysidine(34) synthetase TilS [Ectothiorhodospira sp. 9100]MCG5517931.1 tRNA lysidine(34) synthetase TilS [Ectothiorhodospira sp. 9905]